MTDLIDRYLSAVAGQLPEAQRADVEAELRDALLSDVEAREAELGRPLDRTETAALLKAFGHPLVVAGRYATHSHLIGPEVFPFYWFALRLAIAIAMVVNLAEGAAKVAMASAPSQAIGPLIGDVIGSLMAVVGWTTLAFVIVERTGTGSSLAVWNPLRLPPAASKPRRSRFDAAVEVATAIVFIAWWTGNLGWFADRGPSVVAGPARPLMDLPVLAVAVAGLGLNLVEVARPGWSRLVCGLNLAWSAAALMVMAAYVSMGPLLVAARPSPEGGLERVAGWASTGLGVLLAGIAVVVVWEATVDARWLFRRTPTRQLAHNNGH